MVRDRVESERRECGSAGKDHHKEHEPGQFIWHGLFRLVHGMHRDVKMWIRTRPA
jgi:hypothetical protein